MSTYKQNDFRRHVARGGQLTMFERTAYGTERPLNPPEAHERVELPREHPEPPRAIETGAETRRQAHEEHEARQNAGRGEDPLGLSKREREYFDAVRRAGVIGATTAEVGEALGMPVNRLTQACLSLRKRGLLSPLAKRRCRVTGSIAQAYAPRQSDPSRSVNPCVRAYGYGPMERTCKSCKLLIPKTISGRGVYKCGLRSNTNGPGTDHRAGWPACAKYEPRVEG